MHSSVRSVDTQTAGLAAEALPVEADLVCRAADRDVLR